MGNIVVECNLTEESVVVVILLVVALNSEEVETLNGIPFRYNHLVMSTLCCFNDGFINFTMDIDAAPFSLAFLFDTYC